MPTMIDPPQGWLYGFPKILPEPRPKNIRKWLIDNGYPPQKVWQLGEDMFCREWDDTPERCLLIRLKGLLSSPDLAGNRAALLEEIDGVLYANSIQTR